MMTNPAIALPRGSAVNLDARTYAFHASLRKLREDFERLQLDFLSAAHEVGRDIEEEEDTVHTALTMCREVRNALNHASSTIEEMGGTLGGMSFEES